MPLTEIEQRVCATIASRREALLEDLRLHVGLPTGPGGGALDESRERLCARLAALGAVIEHVPGDPKPEWLSSAPAPGGVPPTAVCSRLRGDGPKVLIAGHLDTVHAAESPFRALSVRPDLATATGPGCVDMKGGLVIAAAALEALEECGVAASWTFTLNSDEETGTYHSEACLRTQAALHDVGLALEPALPGGGLAVERMGSGQFMLEARGRSAHVGRAFADSVSAVTKLAEAIVSVASMADAASERILNIGPLQGGAATNAVPDLARAWGNVRYPTAAVAEAIGAGLDSMQTAADAMPLLRVYRSFNRPAKPLTPETERIALRARAAAEDLGQTLPFARTGGVCDGNILQDAGLPTIDTLGVRGGGLHTPDEWIELASLVERCQLLAVLIARLCDINR